MFDIISKIMNKSGKVCAEYETIFMNIEYLMAAKRCIEFRRSKAE